MLQSIVEVNGIPKQFKTDNASAFKSADLKNYLAELNIDLKYSTPYVHTPIGLIERTIRTMEDYVKTFLIEENVKKKKKRAVKRAVKALRFS